MLTEISTLPGWLDETESLKWPITIAVNTKSTSANDLLTVRSTWVNTPSYLCPCSIAKTKLVVSSLTDDRQLGCLQYMSARNIDHCDISKLSWRRPEVCPPRVGPVRQDPALSRPPRAWKLRLYNGPSAVGHELGRENEHSSQ